MNIYIGSCLALNLNYSGCCEWSLSPPCSINGCYCDKDCHNVGNCCSDVADIRCYHVNLTSPMPITTKTFGKKKNNRFIQYVSQSYFQVNKKQFKF